MTDDQHRNNQSITKQIHIQISGDLDAVNAVIALLHALNFMNGAVWSQAIRKRGAKSVVRVASRSMVLDRPEVIEIGAIE